MKKTKQKLVNCLISNKLISWGLLFLRVFIAFMMLRHGLQKITHFAELSNTFFDPIGLGSRLSLMLVIFAEVVCTVFIMMGLLTRFALIPAIFSIGVAAFISHTPFTLGGAELPLLYFGVYIALLLTGPGKYSIDYMFVKKTGSAK